MERFAYCRVSSSDQNENRQLDAIAALGIPSERIFIDKQSGKDFKRPAYQALIKSIKSGDRLFIKSIDRLGRNYKEIQDEWRVITKERGVDIIVLDMPLLDTTRDRDLLGTFIADVVLQILSFVSENERQNIRIRQAEGIAAARARGVKFGSPVIKPPENFPELVRNWERGKLPFKELLQQANLKESTFYRRLRELRAAKAK